MKNILILLISLLFIGCAEETMFKEAIFSGNQIENDIFSPLDLPEENEEFDICTLKPNAPECYTFCELNPDATSCNNLAVDDCSSNPSLPICQSLCDAFPAHQDCIEVSYCDKYPESTECKAYCLAFPNDPDCFNMVDCHDTPNDPSCILFCEMYPHDEICTEITQPLYESGVQNFSQNEDNNKVDILWVIDNSGSMRDEQNALAENFESFIESFLQKTSDFKMGITTTDTYDSNHKGEFQGDVPVIDSSMGNNELKTNFMKNVKVGIYGSGIEKGLLGASMALDKNSDPGSSNYNFLRPEAFLAIIVVSDENDQSHGSVPNYINYYNSFKSKSNNVAVYSIVDLDPNRAPTYYGPRYMEASDLSGGFYESIHSDFAQSLLHIGTDIVDLISSFKLNNVPIITSIEVKVDGVKIERDSVNGWSYNSSEVSIKFNGSSIPGAGAGIEIKYEFIVN